MNQFYRPPSQDIWNGRDDGPEAKRFHQVVELLPLDGPVPTSRKTFAFLGFCSDEGVRRNQGNVGAAEGPRHLRHALASLPYPRQDDWRVVDSGDIVCKDGDLEGAQKALGDTIASLIKAEMTPIVLGGGHEVAWGHYQGIIKALPKKDCHIVNFDAHYDLRPLLEEGKGSSGTPFKQIASALKEQKKDFHYTCLGIQPAGNTFKLIETAKELQVRTVEAEDFHLNERRGAEKVIDSVLANAEHLYLTICLDVFAAPYAPGVSARQPLGLLPWHVIPHIRTLAASRKLISMDIAELCPQRDSRGTTAQLAASLIHTFMEYYGTKISLST